MKYKKRKARLEVRRREWEKIRSEDKPAYKCPGSYNK